FSANINHHLVQLFCHQTIADNLGGAEGHWGAPASAYLEAAVLRMPMACYIPPFSKPHQVGAFECMPLHLPWVSEH
ncbi:MAG: hypothetical protein ACKO5E_16415, partial [bacterium]